MKSKMSRYGLFIFIMMCINRCATSAEQELNRVLYEDKVVTISLTKSSAKIPRRMIPHRTYTPEEIKRIEAGETVAGETIGYYFAEMYALSVKKASEIGGVKNLPKKVWEENLADQLYVTAEPFSTDHERTLRVAVFEDKLIVAYQSTVDELMVDVVSLNGIAGKNLIERHKLLRIDEAFGPLIREQTILATSEGIFLLVQLDTVQLWEIKKPKPIKVWEKKKE